MAFIKTRDIRPLAIVGSKIADDAVDSRHLVAGGIDTEHLSDDCVTIAKMDDEIIQITSGTIANAAVRTLNATPVTVIPAPGAGKMILVHRVVWELDYTAPGFDAAAAGDTLLLRYTDGSGAAVVSAIAGDTFGGATADTIAVAIGVAVAVAAATSRVNQAIVAAITTGEWYSAAGGSAIKYKIWYSVVDSGL